MDVKKNTRIYSWTARTDIISRANAQREVQKRRRETDGLPIKKKAPGSTAAPVVAVELFLLSLPVMAATLTTTGLKGRQYASTSYSPLLAGMRRSTSIMSWCKRDY